MFNKRKNDEEPWKPSPNQIILAVVSVSWIIGLLACFILSPVVGWIAVVISSLIIIAVGLSIFMES